MKFSARLFLVLFAFLLPAAASAAALGHNLKSGDRGKDVVILQGFLISKHLLAGSSSGGFFSLTKEAVKKYQYSVGLPATGYVGALTRVAINRELESAQNFATGKGAAALAATATLPASTTNSTHGPIDSLIHQAQSVAQSVIQAENTPAASSSIPQVYAAAAVVAGGAQYNPSWSDAIVNLICADRYGGSIVSGTGVIVDPRGVILTNAHVASDFIFAHWPNPSLNDCYVRTGSPAMNQYTATLLYIPDGWIQPGIADLFDPNAAVASTTGAKDYALLAITGSANPNGAPPKTFPYISIYDGKALPVNTPVVLMGYAADGVGIDAFLRDFHLLSTYANVTVQRGVGTSTTADIVAFSGPINSQHGVSGGPVMTGDGRAAGLMTFLDVFKDPNGPDNPNGTGMNIGTSTNQRILNALSTDYILRDFAADTGSPLLSFLANNDPAIAAQKFDAFAQKYRDAFVNIVKERHLSIPGVQ